MALYQVLGLAVAICAGLVIGKLGMESYLEDWVRAVQNTQTPAAALDAGMTWGERIESGFHHAREIVGKVWLYIIASIALGAALGTVLAFMMSVIGHLRGYGNRAVRVSYRPTPQKQMRRGHGARRDSLGGTDGTG